MKKRPKLLAVIICSQLICFAHAQNRFTLPQVSPKSPNAAEFEKYGDIPVSMSNGTANISIPLYTIRVGQLEIPITLSYNSNGLKVDEIPSYVGMGWSINAGGVINYEQRGRADFSDLGMFYGGTGIYTPLDSLKKFLRNGMSPQDANSYLEKLTEGEVDGEFDFYNFNFLGYSGSFYMDTSQRILQVPVSNLSIPDTYTIIDEKGNRYSFLTVDHNEIGPDPDPALAIRPSFNENATRYLSRIQTTDNRTIYFNYGASPFFYSRPSQVVAIMSDRPNANCPASSVGTSYTYYTINNNTLGEISFDGGKVVFETSTEYRNDIHNIDPNSNVPYLKKVKIYNGSNALITEYTFNYTNGGRLVLNEVVKTDTSGTSARWQFEYIGGTSFPNLFLGGTDHWGYANGSSRGIPNANYATLAPGWAGNTNTVNKESDFANSSTSLLKKIVYPTGGSSSFEYESNAITYTSPDQLLGKSFLQRSYPYTYISIVNENTASQDEIYGSFTLTEPTKVSVSAYRWYQPISRIESVVRLSLTPTGTNILDYAPYGFQCGSYACTANAVVTLLQVLIIIR